jgi:hypothetical protein
MCAQGLSGTSLTLDTHEPNNKNFILRHLFMKDICSSEVTKSLPCLSYISFGNRMRCCKEKTILYLICSPLSLLKERSRSMLSVSGLHDSASVWLIRQLPTNPTTPTNTPSKPTANRASPFGHSFLRMKRIAGLTWKLFNCNGNCAYNNGLPVLAVGLEVVT